MTRKIAAASASLSLADVPEGVRSTGRLLILDTVGCALGALTVPSGARLVASRDLFGADGPVTLWGTSARSGAGGAAFVHGNLANALDADESFRNFTHIAAAVVPAVLALAEEREATGPEALTAIVAGYEVAARLGLAMPILHAHEEGGHLHIDWSPTGGQSWLALSAAAGAGRVLRLDAERQAHALGIAAFCAPLPTLGRWWHTFPMPMTKYLMYGAMAQAGVIGARMAAEGVSGDAGILDGDAGFWRLTGALSFSEARAGEPFGARWWMDEVAFKPYPCTRQLHAVLDGVYRLVQEAGVSGLGIDAIEVGVQRATLAPHYQNRSPADAPTAAFSLPYVVALAALGLPPGPQWLQAETLAREDVRTLMGRVQCHEDPRATELVGRQLASPDLAGFEHGLATVSLRAGGRTYTAEVDYATGDQWHGPTRLSPEAIEEKFRRFTAGVLKPAAIESFIAGCRGLEQLDTVRPWLRGLARPAGKGRSQTGRRH